MILDWHSHIYTPEEAADDDVETEDAETGTDVVVLSGGIAVPHKPFLNSVTTGHVRKG
jgi:hypothetical protein